MISQFDLGWLVGILDGEGCFYTALKKNGNGISRVTRIICSSTDKDIIERIVSLCGSKVGGPYIGKSCKKHYWSWNIHGAKAIAIMKMIKPYMSARRQAKITECEELFKESIKRRHDVSSTWLTSLNKTRSYDERKRKTYTIDI